MRDWRIGIPFAVQSHPGFCEADRRAYLFGDKNGQGMATPTLCLKFGGTETVPSSSYASFTACRLINYAPTTFRFPFVQTDSVMVDTTHITNVSFYNTCTLDNLKFLIICIYSTLYRVVKRTVIISHVYNEVTSRLTMTLCARVVRKLLEDCN